MSGLFAFLYGAIKAGIGFSDSVNKGIKESNAKEYARINNSLTYSIGTQEYFLENDIPCRTTYTEMSDFPYY